MPSLLEVIEGKYILGEDVLQNGSAPNAVVPRAAVPQILVLSDCQVSSIIGDEEKLLQFCSSIQEIDLSHNQLTDWNEIAKMLRLFPSLKILNLSFNDLSCPSEACIRQMQQLDTLRLICTKLQWNALWKLLDRATNLKKLDVSWNDFETVEVGVDKEYPSITKLIFRGNLGNTTEKGAEIGKLGRVFPNLTIFSMTKNTSEASPDCWRLFPSLKTLSMCTITANMNADRDQGVKNDYGYMNTVKGVFDELFKDLE